MIKLSLALCVMLLGCASINDASRKQAMIDVTQCAKIAPGYTPSVELDTDGTWNAYCVPSGR